MATTVTNTSTRATGAIGRGGKGFPGPNGNGSHKQNGHGDLFPEEAASRYRIGMWVSVASITMLFTGLSSAYIVRAASATDWRPLGMPRVLLLSTALILASSITIEIARRKLKQLQEQAYLGWLSLTGVLGIGFLVSQYLAWKNLWRQGVFLASSPHSSFFYLLTATHGVHIVCGLLALIYVLLRARGTGTVALAAAKRQGRADALGIYWHFMDALWIYLFLLLFLWRSQ
ncbi:MAG TPA: heme-copper oxidase subunit III [Pyrinomonadaceae bacterium]|jgi:cytochrome c oxidase subunit 3|nr:heme-copper oxidase subunit III [Pyrinomonadaceae bacterium]